MTKRETHPHSEELDKLRAGLLDETPKQKAIVLAHVTDCPACRERIETWDYVLGQFDEGVRGNAPLSRALQARRQAILSNQTGNRPHRPFFTRGLVAAAAVITFGVGLGLFMNLQPLTPIPSAGNNSAVADAASDFYTEIDFYVWLAEQKTLSEQGGNET